MTTQINENEKKVLKVLADDYNEMYWFFRGLVGKTKLELRQVRRACRSLRKKGLAEFSPVFSDEGMIGGSGYGCTMEGKKLIDSLQQQK